MNRTRRGRTGAVAARGAVAAAITGSGTVEVNGRTLPIDVLLDQLAQFLTYSEGFLGALEELDLGAGRTDLP